MYRLQDETAWRALGHASSRLHHRAHATVDVDGDARDEGAGVRTEETGHPRKLLRFAHATEWNAALGHAVDELLVGLALAGRDLVATYPLVAVDQADQHRV